MLENKRIITFLGRSGPLERLYASPGKAVVGWSAVPAPRPKGALADGIVCWKLGPGILPNMGAACPGMEGMLIEGSCCKKETNVTRFK